MQNDQTSHESRPTAHARPPRNLLVPGTTDGHAITDRPHITPANQAVKSIPAETHEVRHVPERAGERRRPEANFSHAIDPRLRHVAVDIETEVGEYTCKRSRCAPSDWAHQRSIPAGGRVWVARGRRRSTRTTTCRWRPSSRVGRLRKRQNPASRRGSMSSRSGPYWI
jgi:hypothetical protein